MEDMSERGGAMMDAAHDAASSLEESLEDVITQRPLATVVVGGMLVGPIMLLLVVPALQILFLGRRGEAGPRTPQARGHAEVDT